MLAVQVGRADLDRLHRHLARQEARQRDLELAVREEEDAAAFKLGAVSAGRGTGALLAGRGHRREMPRINAPGIGCGAQPERGALGAQRERCRQPHGATGLQCTGGIGKEGLRQQEARARPDAGQVRGTARRQEGHRADAERIEQPAHLVLDHLGQRADHQQGWRRIGCRRPHLRHQRGEAGILALGEGRLDAAAGVVQHPDAGCAGAVQPLRRAREVELDDLGRAGPDQEKQPDVRPPREQLADHAVELLVRIGQAGQVALVDDGGGESRLGEDHHAGGRLHQMGAGPRADDEEEGILDLAMQPDDACQPAEHLTLAALAQHRGVRAAGPGGWLRGQAVQRGRAHLEKPSAPESWPRQPVSSRRAARSFMMNCTAFTTYEA